ncbi:MAG: cob(I)yrinic acid a,c-diamide adenosyltransferase [Lachnospiraceae bacterium]|nr:cob(I)yrinic acid a,c-diamide adenosyltransferase [Lachnospiraceae bacterium]
MVHLYTGEGKGKTTAAVGLAVRAAGHDIPVLFAQFMKGNDTGEIHVLKELRQVRILRSDRDFGFYKQMSDADKQQLTEIHDWILGELLEAVQSKQCGMVILDEVTYPVTWGLLDQTRLKKLLEAEDVEIVLTGRNPAPFLEEAADYITEMHCVRHPFERGVTARRGVEY